MLRVKGESLLNYGPPILFARRADSPVQAAKAGRPVRVAPTGKRS